jgi:hypothetical protein
MNLGKLVRDPDLLPVLPTRPKPTMVQEAERSARADFLLRRGKTALDDKKNASWRGTGTFEVAAGGVDPLKALLKTEVTTAATKMRRLSTTMADATKTELVSLDDVSIDPARRFRKRYKPLLPGPPDHRGGREGGRRLPRDDLSHPRGEARSARRRDRDCHHRRG